MMDRSDVPASALLPGALSRCAASFAMAVALAAPLIAQAQALDPSRLAALAALQAANPNGDLSGTSPSDGQAGPSTSALSPASSQPFSPVSISAGSTNSTGIVQSAGTDMVNGSLAGGANSVRLKPPATPGEFETWLRTVTGRKIKRFGTDLLLPAARDFAVPATTTIPPDYALNIGDVVSVSMTGSVEGSASFQIDRDGQIYLPNVGSVSLVGVQYRDLKSRIADAIGRKYRGYEVSVSIAKLSGVRVYVTGFANNPGSYTVNSLSTLVNAVFAAGGPSAGGSFRSVKLYRNGREVTDFDLYQLLRKGDRSHDPLLQNEDVLFIPPVGKQVAVVGSVNEEAIYEARGDESVEDVLRLAGGPTNLADHDRLLLYRLSDRDTVGSRQLDHAQAGAEVAASGDIVQVLPQGSLVRPLDRQQVVVRLEGEVNHPGNYYVAPGTPLKAVVDMAGGLTSRAFVYGTEFSRETVREQQRTSYLEAIDQMETALAVAPSRNDGIGDSAVQAAQLAAARAYLDKLRQKEPDGRLVLDVTPAMTDLPGDILLENNDHIVVPPRVDTVGVFGAVYRPASFLLDRSRRNRVSDYLEEAGGGIRGADRGNIFVVRANGSVLTKRRGALDAEVLPGDAIFVPIRTQYSGVLAKIRDISTILFQFGVTAAAVAAIQ